MLLRCAGTNGQRMHRPVQLVGQHIHHMALAFEPRHAFKRRRHDNDPEMGFTFGARPAMSGVQKGLVNDLKIIRRKGGLQFFFDLAGDVSHHISRVFLRICVLLQPHYIRLVLQYTCLRHSLRWLLTARAGTL